MAFTFVVVVLGLIVEVQTYKINRHHKFCVIIILPNMEYIFVVVVVVPFVTKLKHLFIRRFDKSEKKIFKLLVKFF